MKQEMPIAFSTMHLYEHQERSVTHMRQRLKSRPRRPQRGRRLNRRPLFMFLLGMAAFFVMFLGFSAFQWNPFSSSQVVYKSISSVVTKPQPTPLERIMANGSVEPLYVRLLPLKLANPVQEVTPLDYTFAPDAPAAQKLLPILPVQEDAELKAKLENLFAAYPSRFVPHVYVYDPNDQTHVGINAYDDVSAASVIKLPVLLGFFQGVDEGKLSVDDAILYQDHLRAGGAGELQYKDSGDTLPAYDVAKNMIQISDNTCTNLIISALGGYDVVNERLRRMGLQKTTVRNWLPDLEGTNKISMYEMATLLYNLDRGYLLSPGSREMALDILKGTHNRRLLVAPLPAGTIVAHKTGDIGSALADSGIVYMPKSLSPLNQPAVAAGNTGLSEPMSDYIVSIQVDRPYNDYTARDIIQQASRLIYDHMLAKRETQAAQQLLVRGQDGTSAR